jgi:Pyruvate/2-oxoacid:ferredoxin oxidoreductase delta subunit
MAAILGYNNVYYQITTNGGQCISCGNCSTYCEMGIDVRSYAEKEKTLFVPPVGCGICAAVCPRGLLKLKEMTPAGQIRTILLEMM